MQIIHAEDLAWSHAQSSFQSSSAGAGFAAHVASEAQVPSELEAPEAWRSFVESHQKKGDNFRWWRSPRGLLHHLKRPPFFWEPLPKVNKYKNMDIHMKNTKRFLNIMACFNANWRWWWIYPKMLPLFHRHRLGSNCFRCHFLYGNSLRAKRVCKMFSCTISSSWNVQISTRAKKTKTNPTIPILPLQRITRWRRMAAGYVWTEFLKTDMQTPNVWKEQHVWKLHYMPMFVHTWMFHWKKNSCGQSCTCKYRASALLI